MDSSSSQKSGSNLGIIIIIIIFLILIAVGIGLFFYFRRRDVNGCCCNTSTGTTSITTQSGCSGVGLTWNEADTSCSNTTCTAAISCTEITDCSGGQTCINNICQKCTQDSQCGAGFSCISGSCTLQNCIDNSVCNPGQVCIDSVCQNCSSTAECTSPSICNTTTGLCGPCTTNSQCPSNTPICNGGVCTASCRTNATCGNFVCNINSQLCQACNISTAYACTAPDVCNTGNGQCLPPCTSDSDCSGGFICNNGTCGQCTTSTQCPSDAPVCDLMTGLCNACDFNSCPVEFSTDFQSNDSTYIFNFYSSIPTGNCLLGNPNLSGCPIIPGASVTFPGNTYSVMSTIASPVTGQDYVGIFFNNGYEALTFTVVKLIPEGVPNTIISSITWNYSPESQNSSIVIGYAPI